MKAKLILSMILFSFCAYAIEDVETGNTPEHDPPVETCFSRIKNMCVNIACYRLECHCCLCFMGRWDGMMGVTSNDNCCCSVSCVKCRKK